MYDAKRMEEVRANAAENTRKIVSLACSELQRQKDQAEARAARLEQDREQATAQSTALTAEVARLQGELASAVEARDAAVADKEAVADRLQGKAEQRYREVSALDFYDAVLTIPRLADAYDPNKGWTVTCREGFQLDEVLQAVRVIPLGHFNSGKTWLIGQLSGSDLPKGVNIHTEGLSVKVADADRLRIVLLDTKGANSPMDSLPEHLADQPADGSRTHSEALEAMLQELRIQEDFYRQLSFQLGQVILLVVAQMSHNDQVDLVRLARAIRKDRVRKDIVVVHNLREWSREMLLEPSSKDNLNYVERQRRVFGLKDTSLLVTLGNEAEMVTRHEGLLEGSDQNGSPVKVVHYYLTNDRLECSINRFAIRDIRSVITNAGTTTKALSEELAAGATRIQSRFARFSGDEPAIIFDPEKLRFGVGPEAKEVAVAMKPRTLGSYFAMGSDDAPYNVTMVPCIVRTSTGRGTNRREVEEERSAYQLQLELPGLGTETVERLRKDIHPKGTSGPLRKERCEEEVCVVVDFQATLMNISEQLFERVMQDTGNEVALETNAAKHRIHDAGSRGTYANGSRSLRVNLRTDLSDWDTSQAPVITYERGILGITLVREGGGKGWEVVGEAARAEGRQRAPVGP